MFKKNFVVYSLLLIVFISIYSESITAASSQTSNTWRQLNLSSEQISWLEKHPKLRLGIDKNFSPYESIDENGDYIGIAADYIGLLEEKLGVTFVPVTNKSNWGEVLKAAQSGEFDLMSCLVETADRKEYLTFTEPYLSSRAVIISELSRGYVSSLNKLKGMKVAIHKGHFTNELLRRDYPEIIIVNTSTIQQALHKVADGEADAFVGDATAASFVMKQEGILNLSFSGHTDYLSEFRMGVFHGNPELSEIIQIALSSITEEERNKIYDHWSGLVIKLGIPIKKIMIIAAVALVILFISMYWNYKLQKSKEAHRLSEERFKNLVDTTDGIVWEADAASHRCTYISANAERILGHAVQEWLQPHFWEQHIHSDDRQRVIQECTAKSTDLQDYEIEYRFMAHDGSTKWVRDLVSIVAKDQKAFLLRGLILDITAQKKAEQRIRESEHRFKELIESLPAIAVQGYDQNLNVIYWNDASTKLYGFSRAEAIGKPLYELIIPSAMRDEVFQKHKDWLEQGQIIPPSELDLLHKDGRTVPVYSSHVLLDTHNNHKEMYCIDISLAEQKKAHAELVHLAHFDPLTKLPNRRTCSDRLTQMMKRAKHDGRQVAVMMIDLDHFKEVNDSLGHDHGDLLLQEASARLNSCIRESDTVARLGGDEFLIILESISELEAIERIAHNFLDKMAEPFELNDHRSYLSASIGITFYPNDAHTKEALLKNADQAMYAAKGKGRNRFHYFTPEMESFANNRRKTINQLRDSIEQQQLEVYYQPIVKIEDKQLVKAEALLRWNHPDGLVYPADFIPLSEETGLIVDIGNWVFKEAARQSEEWNNRFSRDLQISVNTSPVQYQDEYFCTPTWFKETLSASKHLESLCVEITESLLLELNEETLDKLLMFRDKGMEVALDDFGTGYSSLAYLKQFDIDYLKIDQSFVRNLEPNSSDYILCKAIIGMAHTLDIKVIAEGIETEEQYNLLRELDCDFGQGYLFSRPLKAMDFADAWLMGEANIEHGS